MGKRLREACCFVAAAALVTVAVAQPAPESAAGPASSSMPASDRAASRSSTTPVDDSTAAFVADTARGGGRDGATFFVLTQVDDGPTLETSIEASKAASRGRGPNLRVVRRERAVRSGRARLKLVATIGYAAPIQEIFSSMRPKRGTEGVVDVTLLPGRRYIVNGTIDPYRTEVWLEDAETHAIVSDKIAVPPSADLLAQSIAAGRYTCCNLRYDDTSINDANATSEPFIPLGARVKVVGWGRGKANVLVEGRPMVMEIDVGDKVLTREQLVDRFVVDSDPNIRLASFAPEVQARIRAGRIALGMTREQVLMAIGYPRPDLTPVLDVDTWVYQERRDTPFTIVWGSDGRVVRFDADETVRASVMP